MMRLHACRCVSWFEVLVLYSGLRGSPHGLLCGEAVYGRASWRCNWMLRNRALQCKVWMAQARHDFVVQHTTC